MQGNSIEDNIGYYRVSDFIPSKIPIGVSTWWLWVKQGRAPSPIKISSNTTVWKKSEILEFIDSLSEVHNES